MKLLLFKIFGDFVTCSTPKFLSILAIPFNLMTEYNLSELAWKYADYLSAEHCANCKLDGSTLELWIMDCLGGVSNLWHASCTRALKGMFSLILQRLPTMFLGKHDSSATTFTTHS